MKVQKIPACLLNLIQFQLFLRSTKGHAERPMVSDEQKFGLTNGPVGYPDRMKE